MGALHELESAEALSSFLASHPRSLVCFSATWCGPCQRSKPRLEALAATYDADPHVSVACAVAYEHNLGDAVQRHKVRAFPTYALFGTAEEELGRVQGADFDAIEALVAKHCRGHAYGAGTSLGGGVGGGGGAPASAADARAQRLARFGGGGNGNVPDAAAAKKEEEEGGGGKSEEVPDEEMKDANAAAAAAPAPSPPAAAEQNEEGGEKMEVDEAEKSGDKCEAVEMIDPTEGLKQEDVETLTGAMGFSLIRAQKGLLNGNGTVEGAVEWLLTHQEDADIDDPVEKVPKGGGGGGVVAQSYKCNECGKILSNMANLELHANKTGHSDFEESTEAKKPLTAEEKAAKIAEIKSLLVAKRTERENVEKAENVDREKQRRFMGKEMTKTREQMEIEQRKRMAQQRKREKEAAVRERQRIRAELEKDKRERAANKGKLGSRLGVDGYQPDGIQYDVPAGEGGGGEGGEGGDGGADAAAAKKPKRAPPTAAKMDEYIQKVSSYRAGGDGGNCLKILKAYLGNVVKHPDDPKYRRINTENKAYKTKVKPFVGAKSLLLCVGFAPTEDGTAMELAEEADMETLTRAKEKVEAAYEKYTK
ncbi:hypothetical protein ACHAWF_003359 [Thalassiosira exigua]